MTEEIILATGAENWKSEIPTTEHKEFCKGAVDIMCRFYGVNRLDFDQKLQEGYTRVSYGRSLLGWHDEKNGKYIVSFAAFIKGNSGSIETFEIRKVCDAFGSFSEGLSRNTYSPDKYQKTTDKFKLILTTEDLTGFIQRFSWSQ